MGVYGIERAATRASGSLTTGSRFCWNCPLAAILALVGIAIAATGAAIARD